MFGFLVLIGLFVALTPGILFKLKGSKMVVAAMHAVLFGLVVCLLRGTVEGFQTINPTPCPPGSIFSPGTLSRLGLVNPTCTSIIEAATSPAPIICPPAAVARGYTPNFDGPPRAPLTAGPFCGLWVDKAGKWLYTTAQFKCPDGGKAVGNYRSTGENRTGTCYTCPAGYTYVGSTKCKITTPAKCPDGYKLTSGKCIEVITSYTNRFGDVLKVGDEVVVYSTFSITPGIIVEIQQILPVPTIRIKKSNGLGSFNTFTTVNIYPKNASRALELYSQGRISKSIATAMGMLSSGSLANTAGSIIGSPVTPTPGTVVGGHGGLLRVGDSIACIHAFGAYNPGTISEILNANSMWVKLSNQWGTGTSFHRDSKLCYPVNARLAWNLYDEGKITISLAKAMGLLFDSSNQPIDPISYEEKGGVQSGSGGSVGPAVLGVQVTGGLGGLPSIGSLANTSAGSVGPTGKEIKVGTNVTCLGLPEFIVETISEIDGITHVSNAGGKPIPASMCTVVKPFETSLPRPIEPGVSVTV